jgi:hypothetical protein
MSESKSFDRPSRTFRSAMLQGTGVALVTPFLLLMVYVFEGARAGYYHVPFTDVTVNSGKKTPGPSVSPPVVSFQDLPERALAMVGVGLRGAAILLLAAFVASHGLLTRAEGSATAIVEPGPITIDHCPT